MAKELKNLTKRADNYSQWYLALIHISVLAYPGEDIQEPYADFINKVCVSVVGILFCVRTNLVDEVCVLSLIHIL